MKLKILSIKTIIRLIALLTISCNLIAGNVFLSQSIIQWVKINSSPLSQSINLHLLVENLDSATISCGYRCKILKLSTTPFSDKGVLNLRVEESLCGGEVNLPFTLENNVLTTPLRTYRVELGGTYCSWKKINVVVSGDPYSDTGYAIDLINIKEALH